MGLARSAHDDKSPARLVDRIGAFTAIPNRFIEESSGLSIHSKWLFIGLRFFASSQNDCVFPSYDTLRSLTGLRREMISKGLRELSSAGWVTKKKRFGKSTIYTLVMPSHRSAQSSLKTRSNNRAEKKMRKDIAELDENEINEGGGL